MRQQIAPAIKVNPKQSEPYEAEEKKSFKIPEEETWLSQILWEADNKDHLINTLKKTKVNEDLIEKMEPDMQVEMVTRITGWDVKNQNVLDLINKMEKEISDLREQKIIRQASKHRGGISSQEEYENKLRSAEKLRNELIRLSIEPSSRIDSPSKM